MRDDLPYFFIELSNVGEGSARNIRLEIVPELLSENNDQDENGTDVSHRLSPTVLSLTLPESDAGTIPSHQSYIEPRESEHLAQLASLNFQDRFLENKDHQRTVWDSVLDDLASLGVTKLRLKFTIHYEGSVQSYSDLFLDYVIPIDPQMNSKQEFSNGIPYSRYELEPRQLEYEFEELE